ncbi:MAG: dienelactone hydrolase family protein [Ottowia sp.]|uniref:dienelactone hydrolase family protein n=1 Tax=Ottowia sp. TaxID=1898956 RepID=UPI003C76228C
MALIIETEQGTFTGYLALPKGPPRGLVVVTQEIYGVNREVRRVADWLAAAGYAAVAPDLLWRVAPELDFGYADRDNARQAIGKLQPERIVSDIAAAAHALRAHVPQGSNLGLALLALGWGGLYAYQAAGLSQASAIVSYYPGNLPNGIDIAKSIGIPQQIHLAFHDERTKPEFRRSLREALAGLDDAEVLVYPDADHGFANRDRQEFHAESARLADDRTLDFLVRTLQHADAPA